MQSIDESRAPNIFASDNPAFKELHYTMDSCTSSFVQMELDLRRILLSLSRNMRILWGYWVVGLWLPCCELYFFITAKISALEEHRSLKVSVYERSKWLCVYWECVKESPSWHQSSEAKNKRVEVRENRDAGDRCHCRCLDQHISKMPEDAKSKDLFYLCPLEKVKNEEGCW